MRRGCIFLLVMLNVWMLFAAGGLTEETTNVFGFIVEEEKLAIDLHTRLYEKWGDSLFQDYAALRTSQLDLIRKSVAIPYGILLPETLDTPAFYTNQTLAHLYAQLTEAGFGSREGAFQAGAMIEEKWLFDVENAYQVELNEAFRAFYKEIAAESEKQFCAYLAQLKGLGVLYQAQFFSQERLQQMTNTQSNTGLGGQNKGNNGGEGSQSQGGQGGNGGGSGQGGNGGGQGGGNGGK